MELTASTSPVPLGVAFTEYFPFVFLCYLTPIMGLICAATGWGIARYKEGELHES